MPILDIFPIFLDGKKQINPSLNLASTVFKKNSDKSSLDDRYIYNTN